jgi:hypothetical protein
MPLGCDTTFRIGMIFLVELQPTTYYFLSVYLRIIDLGSVEMMMILISYSVDVPFSIFLFSNKQPVTDKNKIFI